MLNEWRSNIWLILELIIVGGCLFYVVFTLYNSIRVYLIPEGYDGRGTYMLNVTYHEPSHPEYVPYDSVADDPMYVNNAKVGEMSRLFSLIASNPMVDKFGYGDNAHPYNKNFYGNNYYLTNGSDTLSFYTNHRVMSDEYPAIMRIKGYGPTKDGDIAEVLRRGDILVSANIFDKINKVLVDSGKPPYRSAEEFIGLVIRDRMGRPLRIGGLVEPMKRYQFEEPLYVTSIARASVDDDKTIYWNMALSLKPGVNPLDFEEDFKEKASGLYRVGNLYVANISRTDNIMEEEGRYERSEMLKTAAGIMFLSMSIFLGILGTFWFRTKLRTREIAIRMVNGATHADIFRRLVSEGLVLLCVATPFILAIEWLICSKQLGGEYMEPDQPFAYVLWANAYTFLALIVMIVAGISIPAWKAMKVFPADALKED